MYNESKGRDGISSTICALRTPGRVRTLTSSPYLSSSTGGLRCVHAGCLAPHFEAGGTGTISLTCEKGGVGVADLGQTCGAASVPRTGTPHKTLRSFCSHFLPSLSLSLTHSHTHTHTHTQLWRPAPRSLRLKTLGQFSSATSQFADADAAPHPVSSKSTTARSSSARTTRSCSRRT